MSKSEADDSLFRRESFADRVHALHKISLIAFLAWVGLGADGLSSSAYGPEWLGVPMVVLPVRANL